jgi:single-strand DNA-binding protein
MADLNEWKGIGRLGKDPEVRYLANGDAVTSFSIACDDSYKDKQTGAKVERTEWVRCVAFRQTAEFLGEWLRKGARILVCGKLKTREYEKDGVKHYVTEIHADRGTQIIDWPERDPNQSQQQRPAQTNQQPRQQQQRPTGNNQQQRQQQAAPQPSPDFDSFDDDIPFN